MDDFPSAVFGSKDGCDPQGDRSRLLPSAHLGLVALDLHEVSKLRRFVFGYQVESGELAVSVIGSRPLESLLDGGTPSAEGTKWVASVSPALAIGGWPASAWT